MTDTMTPPTTVTATSHAASNHMSLLIVVSPGKGDCMSETSLGVLWARHDMNASGKQKGSI